VVVEGGKSLYVSEGQLAGRKRPASRCTKKISLKKGGSGLLSLSRKEKIEVARGALQLRDQGRGEADSDGEKKKGTRNSRGVFTAEREGEGLSDSNASLREEGVGFWKSVSCDKGGGSEGA